MKDSMRDFYEQTLLCAVSIVVVLHLNSYFSPRESGIELAGQQPAQRAQTLPVASTDAVNRDSVAQFQELRQAISKQDTSRVR